jgi:NFU1 iron-sulfur cluster scaffold homolog, mitochondrial
MPITAELTPNPNARKFTVGQPVGGPVTHTAGSEPDDPMAASLVSLPGVTSVFMTADFVTVSKSADGDWAVIEPQAIEILSAHYET